MGRALHFVNEFLDSGTLFQSTPALWDGRFVMKK
ncbi:protein of unknown function [Trichlorobacter ammonificans]|uniref:Uncharacterized protein n=1 Tax=Trichlorobacter ammonificans TaxID=2916410 RepID=A0ABN8HL99_9BACT|nr:protein of unknown function [Trichlorobacter ammonificans]